MKQLINNLLRVDIYNISFILDVLLRIPTAGQPMTETEGFKYRASDG